MSKKPVTMKAEAERRSLRGAVRLRSQHPHDPPPPEDIFVPVRMADHFVPIDRTGRRAQSRAAIRRLKSLFRVNSFGRGPAILAEREKIKKQTIQNRRLIHQRQEA